jgi:hypothetical protein
MTTRVRIGCIGLFALVLIAAAPLPAATYVVTLNSGATFETRYKPKQAPWDAQKVLVYSDVGNWLTLARADIQSVVNSLQSSGFGHVLDTTTVELGYAPNDVATPDEARAAMLANPVLPSAPNYTVQQFVEPNATQGLPIFGAGGQFGGASYLGPGGYQPGFSFGAAVPANPAPSGAVAVEPVNRP